MTSSEVPIITDVRRIAAHYMLKPTRFVEAMMLRRHDPVPLKLPLTIYLSWVGLVVTIFWLMFKVAAR